MFCLCYRTWVFCVSPTYTILTIILTQSKDLDTACQCFTHDHIDPDISCGALGEDLAKPFMKFKGLAVNIKTVKIIVVVINLLVYGFITAHHGRTPEYTHEGCSQNCDFQSSPNFAWERIGLIC